MLSYLRAVCFIGFLYGFVGLGIVCERDCFLCFGFMCGFGLGSLVDFMLSYGICVDSCVIHCFGDLWLSGFICLVYPCSAVWFHGNLGWVCPRFLMFPVIGIDSH